MRDGILPEDFAKLLIRFTHEKKRRGKARALYLLASDVYRSSRMRNIRRSGSAAPQSS